MDTVTNNEKAAVFDFGGVLFKTSATEMYREIFARDGRSEEELKHFLTDVFTKELRSAANLGNMKDVTGPLAEKHPEWAQYIHAFDADRDFVRQVRGKIEGMEQTLRDLKKEGVRIYGLTNWASDTFDALAEAYPAVTSLFNKVVVSGKVGMKKPSPQIFQLTQQELGGVRPENVYYFDDKPGNVEAARRAAGWNAFVFKDASTVRKALSL